MKCDMEETKSLPTNWRIHKELKGEWGTLEPTPPPAEYDPKEAPEFLQEAVNLSIELRAATRETETLKTFLKELHLLTAYQDWKAEQEEKETEL